MNSPIILFTYNRPFETEQTISTLRDNYLAKDSILYIFSDGPKNQASILGVQKTRSIINKIDGFKDIKIIESATNKGLSKSIMEGVSQVFEEYDKAIVLEDDLMTSPNFLDFMNQALDFYKDQNKVLSVSGFTLPLEGLPENADFYTGLRASSWAWGSWKRAWENIDWEVKDFDQFYSNKTARRQFNRGGSDMTKMLRDQIGGRIDSWAIRFCYHQFKHEMVTVFPTSSKAACIGFGPDATHTVNEWRFQTRLDSGKQRSFMFGRTIDVDPVLANSFRKFFSVRVRIRALIERKIRKLLEAVN